jgi:hypothetical protein
MQRFGTVLKRINAGNIFEWKKMTIPPSPVLHIAGCDKFLPPFIEFIKINFDFSQHQFVLSHGMGSNRVKKEKNIFSANPGIIQRLIFYLKFLQKAQKSKIIIMHGLFDPGLIILLAFQPWLLNRCHWAIWGGDLYDHELGRRAWKWKIKEFFKKIAIPKIGHFITHIKGDYELAQQWYGAKGRWHECFMYPSNLFKDYLITPKPHEGINILLGNSATPTNNHLDAMEKLRPFAGESIRIYCPLSYGDAAYAEQIAQAGQKIFGEKFIALREFMPFEKYLELLAEIDIAVFNHNRQQGMGNITTLLGLGKVVYMRKEITSWTTLEKIGIHIYSIEKLDRLNKNEKGLIENTRLIAEYFSEKKLLLTWSNIFSK